MVKVAFGGISHETNTFVTEAMGLTELKHFHMIKGEALIRTQHGYTAGMVAAAKELGYDCEGLFLGITEPSGIISDIAYESMRDEICARLRACMPVDAVALELHGAGVAESYSDIEGDLARAVRAIVGESVPIVGVFDLHGNISSSCAETFDFMCPVHEYPHTDPYERGLEAVRLLPRLLNGLHTTVYLERVPTLLPLCMMCTQPGFPAYDMNQFMYALESRPGVIDCTVFHGFPFADIPMVGTTVIVTTENDRDLAQSVAREAASWIWRNRERFRLQIKQDGSVQQGVAVGVDAHTASSAVAAAMKSSEVGGPIVVNEASDNTGCGAPGDSTHLLRAMIDAGFGPYEACFGWIYDPQVLAQAQSISIGASFQISLGGKIDPQMCGKPIDAEATLVFVSDGRFDSTPGAMFPGPRNLGPTVLLRIANVDVLVVGVRTQTFDYGAFLAVGIDVTKRRVVGLKSATHFRAGWRSVASRIFTCEATGWSSNVVESFEFMRKNKVSYWPVDQKAIYSNTRPAKL